MSTLDNKHLDLRLFNWEGTISVSNEMTIGGVPPYLINYALSIRGWHYPTKNKILRWLVDTVFPFITD